jgi:hypothetical protein
MRLRHYGIPLFAILLFTVLVASCREDWDNHYYAVAANKSKLNLYQYIQSQSELSIFTRMLKSTGYDTVLNKPQTFTVWAPNDQALINVDLTDTASVRKIVMNHITRFSHPSSGVISKTILMLDNKLLLFAQGAGGYTFGGKPIVKSDLATTNGIIYILSDYAPYQMNIWEFLNNATGIDSVRAYINSLTVNQIDTAASFKDGIFVSTVYKQTNKALTYLGQFKTEDSTYTAIFPDNGAWVEAYNRILPYYNTLSKDGGSSTQIANTKWTLIQDLFFKGKQTLPIVADTLFSTYGHGFANPNRLFTGAQVTEMSNGLSYVTPQLQNSATESWFTEIRVEAENAHIGRLTSNYAATSVSSIGTGYNISKGYYLRLDPTTQSSISKLFVSFPISNTLSAKYNIYCVFVPASIVDTTDHRPYKVQFYLSYINSAGVPVANASVDVNNTVQLPTKTSYTFTTTPSSQPQKMLVVSGFQFPYCNLVNRKDYISSLLSTVTLKVQNAAGVTSSELANFNRTLRIDCIILEPVQ